MNIVPIKIDLKLLYENRHLFTDDIHYNSLLLSNVMNTTIQLVDTDKYDSLDNEQKNIIFNFNKTYCIIPIKYILCKEGVYKIIDKEGKVKDGCKFIPWNVYDSYFQSYYENKESCRLNILICMSE